MKLRKVGAIAAIGVLVLAGCNQGGTSGGTKGTINIGIELPQQGSELASTQPEINGIKLAVKDAGNAAGGWTIDIPNSVVLDDAKDGVHDPQTGAQNMQALAANPNVVAVIGPQNSGVAKVQIPISNAAGLLQCSAANTNEGLTKPEFGALDIRKTNPTKINYVRVVTTDDYQGPAAARYILQNLKLKTVYIIDSTDTFGKGIADNFQKYFEANGGTVVARDGAPKTTTDYTALLTAAKSKNPAAIYYGGVTADGAARVLKTAVQLGLNVPFVGPDGIYDGSVKTKDSFLNLAGDDAKLAIATAAAVGDFPGRADFAAKYKAAYNTDPTGYAATAYACAQVVLDAMKRAGPTATDAKDLREKLRAAAVDPSITYTSVIGAFKFDANGDTSQKIISFYAYDATSQDWSFKEQLDFAK
ncbi:MAG TPA: branched-chain amino acid ABC transporter substrate-binding protein [Candidatus Limnocylindrales bacterium]|jgi:branched-chain amino acid transport system substrate-binding protein|nr:branched-chain amino acid ABC transporter substrate-binding protein [Candidatus Limnocylindrales bacterium]